MPCKLFIKKSYIYTQMNYFIGLPYEHFESH